MNDRKKLIREYKQTPTPMGLIRIRNTANGKIFLLTAKNIPGIINSQRFSLENGTHPNSELQSDYRKLGPSGFAFEVVDYLEPREGAGHDYTADLRALGELWMERLKPYGDKGYHTKR
jgi:hypothetical protein